MYSPRVKFVVDIPFDIEIGTYFLNEKIGSFDFGKDRIIQEHPKFETWRALSLKQLERNVSIYVRQYYGVHRDDIERSLKQMERQWRKIESRYFRALRKIFGNLNFAPAKTFRLCGSIFKCGVVSDDLKSFQIWYQTVKEPGEVRRHIAHEILHYYYYNYLRSHGYVKLAKDWDSAEIFNRVILNLPEFIALTKKREIGYAIHTRKTPRYVRIWKKSAGLRQYLSALNEKAEADYADIGKDCHP